MRSSHWIISLVVMLGWVGGCKAEPGHGGGAKPSAPGPSGSVGSKGGGTMDKGLTHQGSGDLPRTITLDLGGGVDMKFVLVPAGKFTMGSPDSEHPGTPSETRHEVTISKPFYIGVYEVTQAQYEAVMGSNPSHFQGPNRPVETVNWRQATEFCDELSKKTGRKVRLPTEAQWEYAARAGTTTAFCYGDTITTAQANFDGEHRVDSGHGKARGETTDVGTFEPNRFGLYDVHGNVAEWCRDQLMTPDYPSDGSPVTDPEGTEGGMRVYRGGSWQSAMVDCRSAARHTGISILKNDRIGFRVIVELAN